MLIELKNNDKEESYIILFKKKYDINFIKYVVNYSIEKQMDIIEQLQYIFDIENIYNYNEIEKVYYVWI